jgi:hypothetical protein
MKRSSVCRQLHARPTAEHGIDLSQPGTPSRATSGGGASNGDAKTAAGGNYRNTSDTVDLGGCRVSRAVASSALRFHSPLGYRGQGGTEAGRSKRFRRSWRTRESVPNRVPAAGSS